MKEIAVTVRAPKGARWRTYDADGRLTFWRRRPQVLPECAWWDAPSDDWTNLARRGNLSHMISLETGVARADWRGSLTKL